MPILIVSGHPEVPVRFASRFLRLVKPFREEELARALSDLFHRSGRLRLLSSPNISVVDRDASPRDLYSMT